MFVKPGVNTVEPDRLGKFLQIRIPHTHALMPETGMEVPDTTHWQLLLRDGDVVLATPPAAPSKSGQKG